MVRGLELGSGGHFTTDLLLGVDRMPPEHRRAYGEYFAEVVAQRGFPLHTASLWNALAFGWSLERGSYLGGSFEVAPVAGDRPLPVGAFVEVPVAGERVAWAEVVHREGRDPVNVDRLGIVAPVASGARLGMLRDRKEVRVREALVLDYEAFGDLREVDADDFERAARRGRLTGDRHLERDVCYPPEDAGADGLTLYARFVFARYCAELFDELLRNHGVGVGPDERWDLLLTSLATVEDLARGAARLRSFGSYHLDAAAYKARLAATGQDALFGADAIRDVVGAVVEPPDPPRAQSRFAGWQPVERPAYRCTGALVREYLERKTRADLEGVTEEEQRLLTGPQYARLALETNLAIADRIGETGILATQGVHVRLDDDWQGSGVWRTTRFHGDPPPESRFGPLVPLGLGYASTTDLAGVSTAEIADTPVEHEASERGWRVALRLVDTFHTDIPICADALAMLPPDGTTVLLELRWGPGNESTRRMRPLDRERRLIRQVPYPLDVFAGAYVSYTVARNGILVTARLTPLAVPARVEGQLLRYEYSEPVFLRESRLAAMDTRSVRRGRTLLDQINEVFRRRGRETAEGGRALRAEEVVAALFGPGTPPEITLPVVIALQAGEFEYRNPEYVWFPRISRRTSPRERIRILAARDRERVERILAPRMVPMGIRRYRTESGRMPSAEKLASYAAARQSNRAEGRLPDKLGPRETWVKPYPIGGEVPLVDALDLDVDAEGMPVAS